MFLSGISFAATLPYGAIVGIEILGIQNEAYALLLTISSIVGAIVAVGMGYFSDKIKDRRLMVIAAALAGALGFGLIYFIRTKLIFSSVLL